MEAHMPDLTLLLVAVVAAVLVLATVVVYDRVVRGLRYRVEALEMEVAEVAVENEMLNELLAAAMQRHPAKGDR